MKEYDIETTAFNVSAERHLLGSILRDNKTADDICPHLDAAAFALSQNTAIYGAMRDLWKRREPIDLVSISDHIGLKQMSTVGGIGYITQLFENVPVATSIDYYVGIVRDCQTRRAIASFADVAKRAAENPEFTVNELLANIERELESIETKSADGSDIYRTDHLAWGTLERVNAAIKSERPMGINTGLHVLDGMTGGLHPTDLIVLAGRPGMGKTTLATNITERVAAQGYGSIFFSIEMSKEQLSDRLVLGGAGISTDTLRRGDMREDQRAPVMKRCDQIARIPFWIDDTAGATVDHITSTARRARRNLRADGIELKLIVIDYLQFIAGSGKAENRTEEVGSMTRALKELAKDMGATVLLLSQLNREVEKRSDKRPLMSDLRSSGSIEQDADLIAFAYRDGHYYDDADQTTAELIIRKNRHGQTGTVNLTFEAEYSRFENA